MTAVRPFAMTCIVALVCGTALMSDFAGADEAANGRPPYLAARYLQSPASSFDELGPGAESILPMEAVLDRLISSRILVKIAGAIEQVEPALECLERLCETDLAQFPRTKRRVALARRQARLRAARR